MFHSPSTSHFSCSVDCFHSRNKLIGRGRETQVKWEQKREQSCQHKKRKGKKPPRKQRSWRHRGSLPPLITAIPTWKCLQVRSDPFLECYMLWKMLPAEPWEGCVSVGASAIQCYMLTLWCWNTSRNWLKECTLYIPLLIWKQNPETIGQVGCGFGFCFFSLYLFNWMLELRGKGDFIPL